MSEEGEEYQYAEVKTLPKQHFLCIEFPGCVKNVENALGALGGMSSLVQVRMAISCAQLLSIWCIWLTSILIAIF